MIRPRLKLKPKRKPRGWWERYAKRLEVELMLAKAQLAASLRKLAA